MVPDNSNEMRFVGVADGDWWTGDKWRDTERCYAVIFIGWHSFPIFIPF